MSGVLHAVHPGMCRWEGGMVSAGEGRDGEAGMQGVCSEVAEMLEEVAKGEEAEMADLPTSPSAPARFSSAVKSAMLAARAAGLNPAAITGRYILQSVAFPAPWPPSKHQSKNALIS